MRHGQSVNHVQTCHAASVASNRDPEEERDTDTSFESTNVKLLSEDFLDFDLHLTLPNIIQELNAQQKLPDGVIQALSQGPL